MTFSERMGLVQRKSLVQADEMDDELRTALWNAAYEAFFMEVSASVARRIRDDVLRYVWTEVWGRRLDALPTTANWVEYLRKWYFEADWNRVYDVIEYVVQLESDIEDVQWFGGATNDALEAGRSAFRLIGTRLQRITGAEEIAAVERALQDTAQVSPAREHLNRAAELLGDRDNPDYRNSIKESISAVEAVCSGLSGKKGSLGSCLKNLPATAALHPALSGAFQKLYGYTSDAQAIRHALSEESTLDHADAMYMLVACSAFVSYLIEKTAEGQPPTPEASA